MSLGLALAAAIALLVLAVASPTRRIQALDDRLERWLGLHRARMERLAEIATLPGERFVHPVVAAMTAVTLSLARGGGTQRFLFPLAAASLGGIITHHAVKFVYHRPRPEGALQRDKTEAAFPSGHTTNATAVMTTSAYLLVREGLVPAPLAVLVVLVVCAATGAVQSPGGGNGEVMSWVAGSRASESPRTRADGMNHSEPAALDVRFRMTVHGQPVIVFMACSEFESTVLPRRSPSAASRPTFSSTRTGPASA